MKDNKSITTNGYIDLDLVETTNNILIIGNTTGFFGNLNNNLFDNNVEFISRLQFIINILNTGKTLTVIGNQNTIDYYNYLICFFKNTNVKFKRTNLRFKCINNDEDYISFLDKLIKQNMKFDYIVQNPPYKGSLHLEFFHKGIDLLSNNGKMTIIEPATWLINVRKTGKAKLYNELKQKYGKHIYKVVIENYNKEFDTAMYVPFSVTYIDIKHEYDVIDFWCCGDHKVVNNIYDCNMIGSYDMIWSILNKIRGYGNTMKNHIYKPGKTIIDNNTYFCKYADIIGGGAIFCASAKKTKIMGGGFKYDSAWIKYKLGEYLRPYNVVYYHHNLNDIKNTLHYAMSTGSNKETDKIADNLYGTKEELENWKHFIFNNKIPLFCSIVLVIDQHNTSKDVLCWLTDKQYSDNEIYKLLNITKEEQEFIDKTLKKYERHSPWFKRYLCGKDSVSNEEVQKFINNL